MMTPFPLERVGGIGPPSAAWKAAIIATIRYPRALSPKNNEKNYGNGHGGESDAVQRV